MPRVRPSTAGEGHERRYFYGSVWAVAVAQPILWFSWLLLPRTQLSDIFKLALFVGILAVMGPPRLPGTPAADAADCGERASLD